MKAAYCSPALEEFNHQQGSTTALVALCLFLFYLLISNFTVRAEGTPYTREVGQGAEAAGLLLLRHECDSAPSLLPSGCSLDTSATLLAASCVLVMRACRC